MAQSKSKSIITGSSTTRCRYCGRPLKNPRSIINGMGPGCYKKWNAKCQSKLSDEVETEQIIELPLQMQHELWQKVSRHTCRLCNAELVIFHGYPNPFGEIKLDGKSYWVFSTCLNCKTQYSLAKLGYNQGGQ